MTHEWQNILLPNISEIYSSPASHPVMFLDQFATQTQPMLGFAIAYIIPGNTIRPNGEGPPFDILNVIYNLADLVNKGAFGLCVWSAAAADASGAEEALLP